MDYKRLQFEFPPTGRVNLFRIGNTLVDTGHLGPPCVDKVIHKVRNGELADIEQALITHPHVDHVGGSFAVPEFAELPHIVYEGANNLISNYRGHIKDLREDIERFTAGTDANLNYFETAYPLNYDYRNDIPIERIVTDGDIVTLGSERFRVLHTPGHSAYQMSLSHEGSGLIFSGDVVLPHKYFMWGPEDYDVGAHRESLKQLRDQDPNILVPSHGTPIQNPKQYIKICLENISEGLETIRETINVRGHVALADLVDDLFEIQGITGPPRHFFMCTAGAFFDYLANRGEITTMVTNEGFVGVEN